MALFQNIDEFRNYCPEVHQHYDWDKLARKVNQITRLRVIPYIGQEFYNSLETKNTPSGVGYWTIGDDFVIGGGSGDASDAEQTLADHLRSAIAYYTYMHLLSMNRVQLGNMGVNEGRSADGTSSPASFHAIQDVKDEAAGVAYEFMDVALTYLDENPADFPLWTASEEYLESRQTFVYSTSQLNRYVHAGYSRHTFLSIRAQLRMVQETKLLPELGQTLHDDLMTKMRDNTLSTQETTLVEYLRAWLAPSAMSHALSMFRVRIIDGGIYIRSQQDGPERRVGGTNLESIQGLAAQLQAQADMNRQRVVDFLIDNTASFPDYTASDYDLWPDGKPSHGLPDNSLDDYGHPRRSFRT